ncbi:MAG TPA: YsnF/AvaK domain-containing protein [Allosphingosinicella sp.]|nr:YsnF/AvaK domain-containing protein [Allosphingosinicella sp.]
MPRTVFASFRTEAEAERALSLVASEATLLDSAVLGDDVAGKLTLDSLQLSREERSACEAQLKRGGFLMIAQAATDEAAQTVLQVLHSSGSDNAPLVIAEAGRAPAVAATQEVAREARVSIVDEEIRIGKREVVRGGAAVHSRVTQAPVQERVELLEEELSVGQRPVNRRLSDDEVSRSGLLQDRVIQFAAMREEAVVSKEPFVREEVVVTKNVTQRTEEIRDTVRRTEVETERLASGEEAQGAR